MTEKTTNLKLPYPTGTDFVARGDDVIADLANTLDAGMIPFRVAAGMRTISHTAAQELGTAIKVMFTVGRFNVPPLVFVSIANEVPNSHLALVRAINATAASFFLTLTPTSGVSVEIPELQVNWFAIQMTSVSAAGGGV